MTHGRETDLAAARRVVEATLRRVYAWSLGTVEFAATAGGRLTVAFP